MGKKRSKGDVVKDITSIGGLMKRDRGSRDQRVYYRGEPVNDWPLLPKLLRADTQAALRDRYPGRGPLELQIALLQRFRRYAWHHHLGESAPSAIGAGPSEDEWLCVSQHYGLPTLLLDWTLNPLVALYFAVRDVPENDGRLWIMDLKPRKYRELQTVYLDQRHPETEQQLQKKTQTPCIVVPWAFTRRIEAQAARFTYSGHEHEPAGDNPTPLDQVESSSAPWSRLRQERVPKERKEKLASELEKCLIHEGRMFPDLDGWARYLARGGL